MDHIAIMKKRWGLLEKIACGEKTIESRWYETKHLPWDKVHEEDRVFFKNSGELVKLSAKVSKVLQFSDLTPVKVHDILSEFGQSDGISLETQKYFFSLFKDKRYCILIFLTNVKPTTPFNIDKTGFGAMSAWITVPDVGKIKTNYGL